MKVLTRAQYECLLRHDFATFAGRCFQELNPQTDLRELESQDDGSADPAVFTEADHDIIRRLQARLRNESG